MFAFKAIELMNWDLWQHVRVPLDEQVIMIAGPNGSGKTTFLDAIRILLGARTLSTSRKVGSYLRGDAGVAVVKAVVTNPLRKGFGKRPFSHRGVFEEEATLACIISRKSGTWQRRYAILPGDAPLEAIREHSPTLSAEEYGADLEKANLPRTLLKILALEQGETNKLCRRTPAQLFEYVLEMQGDKAVMENYAQAREAYTLAGRELREQELRAMEMRRHLTILEHDARSYELFRDLQAELREIREVKLPLARYKSVREQLLLAQAELDEAQAARDAREAEAAGIVGDKERRAEEIASLRERVVEQRTGQQDLLKQKEALDGDYRAVRNKLREIEEVRARLDAAGDIDEGNLDAVEAQRRRLVVAEAAGASELERAGGEVRRLLDEKRRLERGDRPALPPFVESMASALSDAGIEATLLAQVVEVRDPHWQVAIESILGRDRFTFLVDDAHTLEARRLAQRQKYPCYVSAYDRPRRLAGPPGSALEQVEFGDDRVPSWIVGALERVQLVETVKDGMGRGKDAVTITPDGYRQDPRGGVFIGVKELYCGGHAVKERLSDVERRLKELMRLQADREAEGRSLRQSMAQLDLKLEAARERKRFEESAKDLPALQARAEQLEAARRALSEQLMGLMTDADSLNAAILEREKELGLLDYRMRLLEQERNKAHADVQQRHARKRRLAIEIEQVERAVPPEGRTDAALALGETEGELEERARVLDTAVREHAGCKDPGIVEVFDKANADYEGQQRLLVQRQRELRRGELELKKARSSYIRVIDQTLTRYRGNMMSLAKRAGVEIEVHSPRLVDDDDVLSQAGIEIRIGFDGKRPVPVNHPKLSGGQSVIASLILLMALTMQEDDEFGGFFILDEPFAHLSVERIDDITRFLGVTRAQFILTSPTTHNLVVFNPARLTLNLRKKPPTSEFAPVPTFLRR